MRRNAARIVLRVRPPPPAVLNVLIFRVIMNFKKELCLLGARKMTAREDNEAVEKYPASRPFKLLPPALR